MKIFLYSENISNFSELCSGTRALGAEAAAFVIGTMAEANAVAKMGPARVYQIEKNSGKLPESFYEIFKSAFDAEKPNAVFMGVTKSDKYFAARLSAELGTSTLTDLSNITLEGNTISGSKMYYGGVAVMTLKSKGIAVVTVSSGVFEADGKNDGTGVVVPVGFVPGKFDITLIDMRKKEEHTVNLTAAKKIVGVGRGIAKQDDLAMIREFASALGAEVSCSRPIAEGEGWMDKDSYIGVSGIVLKPDVYVAVGISGQIQHMIGINSSKTVIAVNRDKNAPIFKQCDYGIVADLYRVIPELTALIKS